MISLLFFVSCRASFVSLMGEMGVSVGTNGMDEGSSGVEKLLELSDLWTLWAWSVANSDQISLSLYAPILIADRHDLEEKLQGAVQIIEFTRMSLQSEDETAKESKLAEMTVVLMRKKGEISLWVSRLNSNYWVEAREPLLFNIEEFQKELKSEISKMLERSYYRFLDPSTAHRSGALSILPRSDPDQSPQQHHRLLSDAQEPTPNTHSSRSVLSYHYATFVLQKNIASLTWNYFTFQNTHKSTTSIRVTVTTVTPGDPDLYIYLNHPNQYEFSSITYGSDTITILPTNSAVVAIGGLARRITIGVWGWQACTYELRVTIRCTETSGACFCGSRQYPDPSTSTCSACAAGASLCLNFEAESCLPYSVGTAYVAGSFSCKKCVTGVGFNLATWTCNCFAGCDTCESGASTKCLTCKSNASLSAAAPASCTCNSGYYLVIPAQDCVACNPTCLECVGSLGTQCSQCQPNAKLAGTSPNFCSCNDEFFPNPTPKLCSPCDITCFQCSGSASDLCTVCRPHANIQPSGLSGKCVCEPSYYFDIPTKSCSLCHISCKECEGGTDTDCVECKDFAGLKGGSPSKCECEDGAMYIPATGNCKQCDVSCRKCVGTTTSSCVSCKASAHLKGSSPNECECDAGFIPSPDASLCLPCNPICEKCITSSECFSCKANADLKEATCECSVSFYGNPDASNCIACGDGCLACTAAECSKCKPGMLLFEGQCVSECPREYRANSSGGCKGVDLTPPTPSLSVTSDNALSVSFDKPMNCSISVSDVSVEIQTSNNRDVSCTWSEPQFQSTQSLIIVLKIETTYLPADSKVTLTFLNPEDVIDEYEVAMVINRLFGYLNAFGKSPTNVTGVLLQTQVAQQAAAASRGSVSAGAISSIMGGNPTCLMSMVNQIQLISYLSMTKLPLPADFASTLAALNVGQMIPNPFPDFVFNKRNETSQVPPKYVRDYGIASTLFVMNSMSFIGMSCAVLLSFVPFYFLSKVKIKFVADYFKSKLPSLKWNVPIQLWLTSYLDMGVFSLLQLSNASNSVSNWFTGISLCLALIFGAAFLATPLCLIYFLVRNFNLIYSRSDSTFNLKWGALFLPFKSENHYSNIAYYMLFTTRRLTLVVTIILFPDSLRVLALFNTSFCLTVIFPQTFLYLLISRPFVGRIDTIEGIMIEGSTMLVYILASTFTFELSNDLKSLIGALGMWVVRIAIFSSVGISLIRTATMVFGLVKAYGDRMKRIEAKYRLSKSVGPVDTATAPEGEEVSRTVNTFTI